MEVSAGKRKEERRKKKEERRKKGDGGMEGRGMEGWRDGG